jgi:hypothetical protein
MSDLPEYGLTIWWPWCTAIVDGTKRIENREWQPWDEVCGERVAVHCGKTKDDDAAVSIGLESEIDWHPGDGRPFDAVEGCIIGTVRVVGHWRADDPNAADEEPYFGPTQAAWWTGPVGWILRAPVAFVDPIPARGKPGLWKVDEQLQARSDAERDYVDQALERWFSATDSAYR